MATYFVDLVSSLLIFVLILFTSSAFIRSLNRKRKNLDGETILITGAASGIGQQIAWVLGIQFPKAVYILWDINTSGLETTAKTLQKLGVLNVHTYTVDLSKKDEIIKAAKCVQKSYGLVTVLINNAGFSTCANFTDADPNLEEHVIKVNLLAPMWTIRAFLPDMISMGNGHIVSICSGIAFYRFGQYSSYTASKYGLRGFLETLKLEMRQHPQAREIKFSTVYPGLVNTPMINGINFKPRYNIFGVAPMNPKYVAECIVNGILCEKEEIFVPNSVRFAAWFYSFLPNHFVDKLETLLFENIKPAAKLTENSLTKNS